MDLRLNCKTLFSIALLFVSPAFALANPYQPEHMSQADLQLKGSLELAEQGLTQAAFDQAKQTKQLYGHERLFDVSYVNTLVSLAADKDSELGIEILNEAIVTINAARKSKIYDGSGDAEIAFHFMNALGRLSEAVEGISSPIASKLRVSEGQVAERLKSNPSYPKNALEALAKPMVDMAQGYAEQKKVELAFQSIENAIQCGYGDYRNLANEDWFKAIADAVTTKTWMAKFDISYANAVDQWSQQVVSQFQGANFEFSLSDIEGSIVSKRDYAGRVLVVDLWATWCPPCRKGIPEFVKLQKKYKNGVAVLGISMDAPETPTSTMETVSNFAQAQGINYDVALGDTSISSQLAGKMALPTTLFLDRDGRVRYIATGYHDYAKVEAITKVLLSESQLISSSERLPGQNY